MCPWVCVHMASTRPPRKVVASEPRGPKERTGHSEEKLQQRACVPGRVSWRENWGTSYRNETWPTGPPTSSSKPLPSSSEQGIWLTSSDMASLWGDILFENIYLFIFSIACLETGVNSCLSCPCYQPVSTTKVLARQGCATMLAFYFNSQFTGGGSSSCMYPRLSSLLCLSEAVPCKHLTCLVKWYKTAHHKLHAPPCPSYLSKGTPSRLFIHINMHAYTWGKDY